MLAFCPLQRLTLLKLRQKCFADDWGCAWMAVFWRHLEAKTGEVCGCIASEKLKIRSEAPVWERVEDFFKLEIFLKKMRIDADERAHVQLSP